jgi:hypothetical protein
MQRSLIILRGVVILLFHDVTLTLSNTPRNDAVVVLNLAVLVPDRVTPEVAPYFEACDLLNWQLYV